MNACAVTTQWLKKINTHSRTRNTQRNVAMAQIKCQHSGSPYQRGSLCRDGAVIGNQLCVCVRARIFLQQIFGALIKLKLTPLPLQDCLDTERGHVTSSGFEEPWWWTFKTLAASFPVQRRFPPREGSAEEPSPSTTIFARSDLVAREIDVHIL